MHLHIPKAIPQPDPVLSPASHLPVLVFTSGAFPLLPLEMAAREQL